MSWIWLKFTSGNHFEWFYASELDVANKYNPKAQYRLFWGSELGIAKIDFTELVFSDFMLTNMNFQNLIFSYFRHLRWISIQFDLLKPVFIDFRHLIWKLLFVMMCFVFCFLVGTPQHTFQDLSRCRFRVCLLHSFLLVFKIECGCWLPVDFWATLRRQIWE